MQAAQHALAHEPEHGRSDHRHRLLAQVLRLSEVAQLAYEAIGDEDLGGAGEWVSEKIATEKQEPRAARWPA